MSKLDTSHDQIPASGGRRIINVGGHGGIADMSLNQRLMDDLNVSMGAKRYDQHFDSQISHDHSLEHYSSRQHYPTGDLRGSAAQPFKRSETEHFKPNVTFANTNKGNHPLHYKGAMERIEENRSASRGKGSPDAHLLRPESAAKGRGSDISQLTIASHKLEDSIKAPHRPPQRVAGLTQFLIESHYKKIGVFTKNEQELFKFWKDYVSVVYKQYRLDKSLKSNDVSFA